MRQERESSAMLKRLWRRVAPDLCLVSSLLILPLLMFHQQTLGDRTLLPSENLYQYPPYSAYREVVNAPPPHNHLLSDMALQNYQWKRFIRDQIAIGEIPLWNPHLFSGLPFFAAGQHSALYPLSLLYYALPLSSAYGWFIVVNLWLAGIFMALYMRRLGLKRHGAALSGMTYQLCGFMIASAVFPMMVAAAAWLPLILYAIENILSPRRLWIFRGTALPWVCIGGCAVAFNILAGHIELSIYTLLFAALYAGCRLFSQFAEQRRMRGSRLGPWLMTRMLWLALMPPLGLGLSALQLLTMIEFAGGNWRAERSSLETVLGYAHPPRDLLQFVLPNVYGNPTHHSYIDAFNGERVADLTNAAGESINAIDWGIKNYVEGALYLGILPLLLALYAGVSCFRQRNWLGVTLPLMLIAALSLSFMFGADTYRLLFGLPGMNQLHSPFRWVFALSFAVAGLAGIGMHMLAEGRGRRIALSTFALLLMLVGLALLLATAFSFSNFEAIKPLLDRLLRDLAKAADAFADARMFYSYQLPGIVTLGVLTLLSGIVFLWAAYWRRRGWMVLALIMTGADLLLASYGFNPASDPLLLDFTPPAIEYLRGQSGDFRITSVEADPSQPPILNPNLGMQYGLDDVRGYDSIIPAGYVATMRALQPQHQLDFNRISPVYTLPEWNHAGGYEALLKADLFNLLNIRFVLTPPDWLSPPAGWRAVYADEAVTIWENLSVMPRAFVVSKSDWDESWLAEPGGGFKFGAFTNLGSALHVPRYDAASISRDTGREKLIDVSAAEDSWLVISETWTPGWRAFARPRGTGESAEFGLAVRLALANFQAVEVPAGDWTVRLVYSPASVHLGMFASSLSVGLMALLLGIWFWRAYIGMNRADSSGVAKVARNSLAPIILNLFNRGVDMAFAIVMFRLLLPEDIGIYSFAIVLFVWFDIFTNFGLDLFLIREAARDKSRSWRYLFNTSFFRVLLSLVGVPLLAGFLLLWQGSDVESITPEGLTAIGLLYIGLFPASLSKGMTSLFYANEEAEKPAAIATITTINKAVFGVIALLLGYGIVGLAAVSIFNNLLTLLALIWAGRSLIGRMSRLLPDRALMREMIRESFPLMLNHFLATIFFQIDIVILQAIKGAETVAQYNTAYKWLLAINIVPAFFTQALFPVMSRQAQDDRESLSRGFRFGIKLLFALTLPLALAFTVLAQPLTLLLAGARYLPDGALALQLMIWSIPFGWMNSLMQYTLVALGRQRLITRAFAAAVAFNIAANIAFIPRYGFAAAALATIASEIALLLPFILLIRRDLRDLRILTLLWRPLIAFALMCLALQLLGHNIVALGASALIYVLTLVWLKPLDASESAILLRLLPQRFRRIRLGRWLLGA